MYHITILKIFVILLTFIPMNTFAQGENVIILYDHGEKLSGELLSVNDSTITINATIRYLTGWNSSKESTIVINNKEILQITVIGKSQVLKGIGLGILIGAGTGALIGLATYQKPDCSNQFVCLDFGPEFAAAAGAVVLGGVGLVVGTIVGVTSSIDDRNIEPLGSHDFSILKPLSRDQRNEMKPGKIIHR